MRRFLPMMGLLLCALLLRGAVAEAPRPLLRCLPAGGHLLLEVDDLRGLLKRWQAAPLRQAFLRSAARKELERNRVYLKLLSRLESLERLAAAPLTLERMISGTGQRTALSLYDIGETAFVLVTELPLPPPADLLGLRGRLEAREHRGLPYLRAPEGREGPGGILCAALLKNRLLLGNDPARFRDALVLLAQDLGLKVQPGPAPLPADRDPLYLGLRPAAEQLPPRSLRLFVGRGALAGSRPFDQYWITGPGAAQGIRGALLALSLEPAVAETRVYSYATPPALAEGKVDVALPARPYAQVLLCGAPEAAALIAELLPGPGPDSAAELAAALSPAGPHRIVEVADGSRAEMLFRPRGALAIALRQGAALSGPALEQALLGRLGPALGDQRGGPAPAFADENGVRVLRLPLLSGWALSWQRRADVLYLATAPEELTRLAADLGQKGALLREGGPLLRQIDLKRTGDYYKEVTGLLLRRDNWSSRDDAELFGRAVAGLFDVVRPSLREQRLQSVIYRRGPLIIEEVQYR